MGQIKIKGPPHELFTPRLRLRPPLPDDVSWIYETYANDPMATRYLSWNTHQSPEETFIFVQNAMQWWNDGGPHLAWMMEWQALHQRVGSIGIDWHPPTITVGYVLGPLYWNHGFATEALKLVNAWCLTQPEVFRVQAYHDVDNPASGRVMEKAGMRREGIVRRWHIAPNVSDEPRDCVLWSIVRE
jgi:RimJ/RimL family protein N-acetyltransferase